MTQKHELRNSQAREILRLYIEKSIDEITDRGVNIAAELASVGLAIKADGKTWELLIPEGMNRPKMDLEHHPEQSPDARKKIAENYAKRQDGWRKVVKVLALITEESSANGKQALELFSRAQGAEKALAKIQFQIEILDDQLSLHKASPTFHSGIEALQKEVEESQEALATAQRDLGGFNERLERLLFSGLRKRRREKLEKELERRQQEVQKCKDARDLANQKLQQAQEKNARAQGHHAATAASREQLQESKEKLERRMAHFENLLRKRDEASTWVSEETKRIYLSRKFREDAMKSRDEPSKETKMTEPEF